MRRSALGILAWVLGLFAVFCFFTAFVRAQVPANEVEWPPVEIYYSPAWNLEMLDVNLIGSSSKTIDMVSFAMDDKPVAAALLAAAARGVKIRIYRDQTQYNGEVARGKAHPGTDLNDMFAGQPNISIKVKGTVALAHLKSYCIDCGDTSPADHPLLRTGSANFSVPGEKVQDNDLVVIRDTGLEVQFESNFKALWERTSNQTIQ